MPRLFISASRLFLSAFANSGGGVITNSASLEIDPPSKGGLLTIGVSIGTLLTLAFADSAGGVSTAFYKSGTLRTGVSITGGITFSELLLLFDNFLFYAISSLSKSDGNPSSDSVFKLDVFSSFSSSLTGGFYPLISATSHLWSNFKSFIS